MTKAPWWRSASVYQLYVRSFADGDGDGIGDLAGITSRMDYIASLGVDAIWLNPCYPSPQKDHGYDVADYFDIEPAYGSLVAFDALVASAREHGIRVIMDVVPNHCSSEHRWFQDAVAAGPGSPLRDRFFFRPGRGVDGNEPPNNWTAIFGGSVWTRVIEPDGTPGEWYLGIFTPDQPDLNLENADVLQHFDDMLRFWFDRGVDGFRADAVIHAAKTTGLPDHDAVTAPGDTQTWVPNPHFTWVPKGHDTWKRWRAVVDRYNVDHPGRDIMLVAEAYTPERPDLLLDYMNPSEFHQAFAFDLMLSPWRPELFARLIDRTLEALAPAGALPAWTLNNHDAQRSATRYGRADVTLRETLYPGSIVNTTEAVDLALGLQRARAAALLLLALPGCAYLYSGEELGVPEVLDLPDEARQDPVFFRTSGVVYGRDGCRIPLPWTEDPSCSHGFSTGVRPGAVSWLPQPADWGQWAADAQSDDPASTLSLYRRAGAIRRNHSGLRSDEFEWVSSEESVVAFRRGSLICALNMSDRPVSLPVELVRGRRVVASSQAGHTEPTFVPGNAAVWLDRA